MDTNLKKIKHLLIIGCNQQSVKLIKRILINYRNQIDITLISETKMLGINYNDYSKIFSKDKNFNLELVDEKTLQDMGIRDVVRDVNILEIDEKSKKVCYVKKIPEFDAENKRKKYFLEFDFLLYADNPYTVQRPSLIPFEARNVISLSNDMDLHEYKNEFFQRFKSCLIFGTSISGLKLANVLAKMGRQVHLILPKSRIIRNIWDRTINNKILDELKNLKVHIIENPPQIEFALNKKTNYINSLFVKGHSRAVNKIDIDIVFIAESDRLTTDLRAMGRFADIDTTFYTKFGVKRLISEHLQLKLPFIYAMGINTVDRSILKKESSEGLIWNDHIKALNYKADYEIRLFINLIANNELGKYAHDNSVSQITYIDEFIYKGENYQIGQIGETPSFATLTAKGFYGIFNILEEADLWRGMIVNLHFLIDIRDNVIKGAALSIYGPDSVAVKGLFNTLSSILVFFKLAVIKKSEIFDFLYSRMDFVESSSRLNVFLEKMFAAISSFRI